MIDDGGRESDHVERASDDEEREIYGEVSVNDEAIGSDEGCGCGIGGVSDCDCGDCDACQPRARMTLIGC